ncbi:hypothetical protein P872_06320 [Rhodonellum psychrophilum GCM71 = DSM 17998]|uniref:WbqC-like protein n=2 Tax=Rhodonellum TaxID=336827 RepID=U5BR68_9BACT|nr:MULTISPECIES: WbqC family protein [Rhodonellum]ERM83085.1 hypothetical protein P872_06320 [Rhodonellum psychrophilum GCM71 = DSM 17998]MDO9554951.1 WbqC family protein [Rhodonellum sp.]SDZ47004.1 WbqC-like protein family protein [Rhodonellum ikkaensis]
MPIITDLLYLPPIEYFVAIQGHQEIWLDSKERYQKQTFRNRTQIRLANKVENISLPVIGGNKKVNFAEVEIDYNQKWKNIHLRGIQSAYGKAPFYEFYFPYIEDVFAKNLTKLSELNLELLTVCLKLLKLEVSVKYMEIIGEQPNVTDMRGIIHPKEGFEARNILMPTQYSQLFGSEFVPNLSIIDLLFCAGPESKEILTKSQKND